MNKPVSRVRVVWDWVGKRVGASDTPSQDEPQPSPSPDQEQRGKPEVVDWNEPPIPWCPPLLGWALLPHPEAYPPQVYWLHTPGPRYFSKDHCLFPFLSPSSSYPCTGQAGHGRMEPCLTEATATNLTDPGQSVGFCSIVNDGNSTRCGLSKERKSTGVGVYLSGETLLPHTGLRLHF